MLRVGVVLLAFLRQLLAEDAADKAHPWKQSADAADVVGLKGFDYAKYVKDQLAKFEPKTRKLLLSNGTYDEAAAQQGTANAMMAGSASEDSMKRVADYLRANVPLTHRFGLCHGTNHGYEMVWLKKHLPTPYEVLGTELAPLTAKMAPLTLNWDFHVVKPEWRRRADFVYSNAFDHSPNPKLAVTRWMEEVALGGVTILEYSSFHGGRFRSKTDLYGTSFRAFQHMVAEAGSAATPRFSHVATFNNSEYARGFESRKRRFAMRHIRTATCTY